MTGLVEKQIYFVWIDCEMTGLDVFSDRLLEIAILVTLPDCQKILYQNSWALSCTQSRLEQMDAWNQEHHGGSGLWSLCLESSHTAQEVQQVLLRDLRALGMDDQQGFLCGNSIHQDRYFLKKEMPYFEKFLHYRQIDISTLKTLWPFLRPQKSLFEKSNQKHRALDDIMESMQEYLYYQKNLS